MHRFDELQATYCYLLGLYLGDGCISVGPDIRRICSEACALPGLRHTFTPRGVYVPRKADVLRMDAFIGPKT